MADRNIEIIFVKKANEFVGIKINKNVVEFYVPQVFRQENDKQMKKDLLLFLKSISIAKSVENNSIRKR